MLNSIDITTIIGCPNKCIYCPQDVFLKNYEGAKNLTLDDLKLMLKNINNETTMLHFAGYSECFFNKNIVDLLLYCYNSGFVINLFTTLQGFTDNTLSKLKNNIKFREVFFHEYNGIAFNKTDFDSKVNKFITNISYEKYTIVKVDNPISRAGNLSNVETNYKCGKLICNHFNHNLLYWNQLLPNGDVYLCCMDWSLKHKIGNIYENHYDSDEFNKERLKIKELMEKDDSDLICRKCEFSKIINQ